MTTPTAQAPAARADNLSKIYGDGPTRSPRWTMSV